MSDLSSEDGVAETAAPAYREVIRNLTPGLLLRHAFYLAFGAFCGVAFLGGWGVIPGAALGLTMGHFTLKWRKRISVSYDNLNAIFSKTESPDKTQMDFHTYASSPEALLSKPRIYSPLMANEFALFVFEINPIHFLFLFSFERLFLKNSYLYLGAIDAVKPAIELFYRHYTVLNNVFSAMDRHSEVFLKTTIFGVLVINGFIMIYGILKQCRDAPRYHAWMARFTQDHRIDPKIEIRAFPAFCVFALLAFITWADFLGYSDTRIKSFLSSSISVDAINIFPAFYFYSFIFIGISFSSVLLMNYFASAITTFYWMRRHRKIGPGL